MSIPAIHKNRRRVFIKLHRWTGLLLLVFLLIAALTGAILSFSQEVERIVNPELFVVKPESGRVSYAQIIQTVESQYSNVSVSAFRITNKQDQAIQVIVKPKNKEGISQKQSGAVVDQIMVNPYNGNILGSRNTKQLIFSKVNLIPLLSRLHSTLFFGEIGAWIMGITAIIWLITLFFGLVLSWPKKSRKLASWLSLFTVRWSAGNYKINYDLHQSVALLVFPFLAIIAFTAIYLGLPDVVKPLINSVSPLTSPSHFTSETQTDLKVRDFNVDDAIHTIQNQYPKAVVSTINRDTKRKGYSIRFYLPGDVSRNGNNSAFISMKGGDVKYILLAENGSFGDKFISWMRPLHDGHAFGWIGQFVVLVTALSLSLISVTGLTVYVYKIAHRLSSRKLPA
ncbi:MAG: PepSY-associated TM helix domain-containing protein [Chlorobium sp.]